MASSRCIFELYTKHMGKFITYFCQVSLKKHDLKNEIETCDHINSIDGLKDLMSRRNSASKFLLTFIVQFHNFIYCYKV